MAIGDVVSSVSFGNPFGLSFDSDGCLWVINSSDVFYKTDAGSIISSFTTSENNGHTLGIDSSDCIWNISAFAHTMYKYNTAGSLVTSFEITSGSKGGIPEDSDGCFWINAAYSGSYAWGKINPADADGCIISSVTTNSIREYGCAIDSDGCFWTSVGPNANDIRQYSSAGSLIYTMDYSGDYAVGMDFDSDGCLWVSDYGNNLISKIDMTAPIRQSCDDNFAISEAINKGMTNIITDTLAISDTAATMPRSENLTDNLILADATIQPIGFLGLGTAISSFATPASKCYGVGVDTSGYLWLSRDNHDTKVISSFSSPAADYALGLNFDVSGCLWVGNKADFKVYKTDTAGNPISSWLANDNVYGIAVGDSGCVWLSDAGGGYDVIRKYDNDGSLISSFDVPSGYVYFRGLDLDGDGSIWAVCRQSGTNTPTVFLLEANGTPITSFEIIPTQPIGLSLDSDGCVWVNNSTSATTYKYTTGGTLVSSFERPNAYGKDIAFDSNDCVWATDTSADTIMKLNATTIYRTNTAGSIVKSFITPDVEARGIAVDGSGCVWCVDTSADRITQYSNTGTIISSFASPSNGTKGITFDDDGCIWTTDSGTDKVYKLDNTGSAISSFDSPSSYPNGIAFDSKGDIWQNDVVEKVMYRVKTDGTVTDPSFAVGAPVSSARGIALDSDSCFWVADVSGDKIYKLGGPSYTLFQTVIDSLNIDEVTVDTLLIKNLVEAFAISEARTNLASRVFRDSFGIEGTNFVEDYKETLSETFTIEDSFVKLIQTIKTDGFAITDAVVKQTAKIFSSGLTMDDTKALKTIKVIADNLTISEPAMIRTIIKTLTESLLLSDSISTELKGFLTDMQNDFLTILSDVPFSEDVSWQRTTKTEDEMGRVASSTSWTKEINLIIQPITEKDRDVATHGIVVKGHLKGYARGSYKINDTLGLQSIKTGDYITRKDSHKYMVEKIIGKYTGGETEVYRKIILKEIDNG